MRKLAILIFALLCIAPAFAHDHDHPELDAWFKSLTNQNGGSCCDGSDAYSVLDPDWDTTDDPAKPYRVKLEGEWIEVPADRVVKGNNKAGIAKVWPIYQQGKRAVRCFMPGSFS